MTVNCHRCPDGTPYRATGAFTSSRVLAKRAELVCLRCGRVWSSGLPASIELAEAALADQGGQIWRPGQPTPEQQVDLFHHHAPPEPERQQPTITREDLQARQRRQRERALFLHIRELSE